MVERALITKEFVISYLAGQFFGRGLNTCACLTFPEIDMLETMAGLYLEYVTKLREEGKLPEDRATKMYERHAKFEKWLEEMPTCPST